jgi:uncharacterized protein (DUF4415 family)
MKTENDDLSHMTRVVSDGTITPEIATELNAIAALTDDSIDTSDIPEVTDWSNAVVGKFYRPLKETVTVRLDSDVLHWLKLAGKGYQSRLNAILRKEMALQSKTRNAA